MQGRAGRGTLRLARSMSNISRHSDQLASQLPKMRCPSLSSVEQSASDEQFMPNKGWGSGAPILCSGSRHLPLSAGLSGLAGHSASVRQRLGAGLSAAPSPWLQVLACVQVRMAHAGEHDTTSPPVPEQKLSSEQACPALGPPKHSYRGLVPTCVCACVRVCVCRCSSVLHACILTSTCP